MLNGLYGVKFGTPLGSGTGVLYAVNGMVYGGDSGFAYHGTYTAQGTDLTASLRLTRHAETMGVFSVFGSTGGTIDIRGTVTPDGGTFRGTSPQAPGITLSVTLHRIDTA